jgi:dolichyl-diphosphooligosaccharide--protein glycosyltransferase
MALSEQDIVSTVPNYFIVSWENLRLSGWISYYGNWDIVTGTSSPGKIQQVRGEVRIDSSSGSLMINGQPMPLDSLDVVEDKGTRHFEWQNGSGSHVLINQAARQVFLMDQKMYRSMMVQMLIAPPEDFAEDFTLVVDRYPWVRAYKVKG